MLAACSSAAARPQRVVSDASARPARSTRACGRPSVSVPVLSTTSVSTARAARAPRRSCTSTPAVAPRPVPTMIAIGVASPSAHGQAMISTATALTSACARRGSGPQRAPRRRTPATATSDDGRHEPRGDRVGEPLNRRAAPLRLADHPDDLREQRVGADALGAHQERSAGAVDRAARHARARLPCPPGIGSPVTIDSSTSLCPSTTTPSTGTFSPGRTRQTIAGLDLGERHVLLAVVADDARRLAAQGRAAAESRRRSGRARAAPAPGRAARAP